jgi:hypothetical protein
MRNPCKPLLLLDVDGVISLFGFPSSARPDGRWLMVDGTPHLISAAAAGHLQELSQDFDLAWCTGWEEKANEYLCFALGLENELPVLSFDRTPAAGHAHWKLAAIERFAGPQRPLAWIDDSFNEACRDWAGERGAPTLLVHTEPAIGLAGEHVEALLAWARGAVPGSRATRVRS